MLFVGVSGALYVWLLYFTPRTSFVQLLLLFAGLTVLYLWHSQSLWLRKAEPDQARLNGWMYMGMTFRLLALFSIPALSDDFYRFLWDGRLLAQGINPFATLPSEVPAAQYAAWGLSGALFDRLNSPHYYSVYPPLCQALFGLSAWLFPHSDTGALIAMKCGIVAAEALSLYLLPRLLARLGQHPAYAALYALNPVVIVELSGNLHMEALMIAFLLLSLWLFSLNKWKSSAVAMAAAVSAKLLPLIFLPLLIRRMPPIRFVSYGLIATGLSFAAWIPLLKEPGFLANIHNSLSLYFREFEFNASLYYLIRSFGYLWMGFNINKLAGPALAVLVFAAVWCVVWIEKKPGWRNLPGAMLAVYSLWLLFSAVVHPWYVLPLLAICLCGSWRFPLWWSLLLPLTYAQYQYTPYREPLGITAIVYIIVAAIALKEMLQRAQTLRLQQKSTGH